MIEFEYTIGQIFEHVDGTGTRRFFDVDAMRTIAHNCPGNGIELIITDTSAMTADFLLLTRGIEEEKLAALTEADLKDPVLIVEMTDGTHLLVDGHHRWVKRAERGDRHILCYRFPLGTWERYLLTKAS